MAGAPQSPLKLTDVEHSTSIKIYNPQGTISGNHTRATMVSGGNMPTMWFVYSADHWGHADSGTGTSRSVGISGGAGIQTPFAIKSAQGFNVTDPGVVVFEHSQYRGYGNLYENSVPDLTASFPQGKVPGVSSVYISGGVWTLYNGYDYTGEVLSYNEKEELGPGFYDFGALPVNDQAKSLKYVRPE